MASSLHYSESPYLCCGVGLTCAGEAEPLWGYCAVTGKVKNRSVLRTGCEPVNITANGPGTSFGFNAENFLTTAGASTYTVDAQGRPTKKTVSGTTTNYFYSSSVVISEQQGSTWTDYIFFGNQRIAKQTGSTSTTATYLHADHLGSTRRCSDSNGNSNGSCDYEPFGECQPSSSCSSLPTNYRFAGMEFDAESALYHTLFRQYDPNQGRWTGVDALPGSSDAPQSLNRYTYAGNDSVNLTDPSGLCTVSFDYSYYLYGYISGGIFHVVGGWIEITNFRTDCGTQRLGEGGGPGGGGHGAPIPGAGADLSKLLPQAQEPQKPCQDLQRGNPQEYAFVAGNYRGGGVCWSVERSAHGIQQRARSIRALCARNQFSAGLY